MSPTEYLDQLDRAHEAATPGPWATDEAHGRDICDEAYSWHAVVQPNGDEVATTWPVGHERHDPAADAALIVAAVNAQPKLTAALRGLLELADGLDGEAAERQRMADRLPNQPAYRMEINRLVVAAEHQRRCAKRIRRVVTDALGGAE